MHFLATVSIYSHRKQDVAYDSGVVSACKRLSELMTAVIGLDSFSDVLLVKYHKIYIFYSWSVLSQQNKAPLTTRQDTTDCLFVHNVRLERHSDHMGT